MVMQQVARLALNISLRVFLSTCYSGIIFCFVYSVMQRNSLIVVPFCNRRFNNFVGTSEQVVEISGVPDGEDSVTVFTVVAFYNLVDGYQRFVGSSLMIKMYMEVALCS